MSQRPPHQTCPLPPAAPATPGALSTFCSFSGFRDPPFLPMERVDRTHFPRPRRARSHPRACLHGFAVSLIGLQLGAFCKVHGGVNARGCECTGRGGQLAHLCMNRDENVGAPYSAAVSDTTALASGCKEGGCCPFPGPIHCCSAASRRPSPASRAGMSPCCHPPRKTAEQVAAGRILVRWTQEGHGVNPAHRGVHRSVLTPGPVGSARKQRCQQDERQENLLLQPQGFSN